MKARLHRQDILFVYAHYDPYCMTVILSILLLLDTGPIYLVGVPQQIGTIPNLGGRYACGALQLSPENPPRILIAKDGETVLLGGFKKVEKSTITERVPILGLILPMP